MKALRLPSKAGDVVIHRRRPETFLCEAFAELFEKHTGRPLVYRGESLASFANKAFLELTRPPPRRPLADEQYHRLWEEQGSACNLCGASGNETKWDVDHKDPRFLGGGDDLDNLQILCPDCHASKTSLESLSYVEDEHPLLSRFSLETYDAFVNSPKLPQLVANLHKREDAAVSIDVIRCRYNAFVEQDAWDLPIFAPTDEMKPTVPGELGDYQWIDIGPLGSKRSPRTVLPYRGPLWYGPSIAAFLLDAGIATWCDFKLTYNAATKRPASFVGERLRVLNDIALELGRTFVAQAFLERRGAKTSDPEALAQLLAKTLTVSCLGVWACREHWRLKHFTTSCPDDVLFGGPVSIADTPGSPQEHGTSVFKDLLAKQRVLELTSMRPIHQRCLEEEHLQIARALLLATRARDPKYLISLRVDEVFLRVPPRDQERFKAMVAGVDYSNVHSILPSGRRPEHQRPSSSTAPVFRVKFVPQAALSGGELREPAETPTPFLAPAVWETFHEPLGGPDDFGQRFVADVLAGRSPYLGGAAGTGKTVILRATKAALEEAGLTCAAICLTHTGARNIGEGATTAHSFVMKYVLHGTFSGQVVLIEEISFMSLDLLAALEHLRLKGVLLICFGDFGQLPPVSNRWRGQEVAPDVFEHSRLFHSWSGGRRYVLGRCRRSDQAHFDFYTSLGTLGLEQALEAALARHPPRGDCDWNIVMSHKKRRMLNERLQRKAAAAYEGEDKLWIEAPDASFHCFPGTKLIGCNNTFKKIVNGSFLKVTSVSPETIGLLDEDTGAEFDVSPAQIAKHTRLSWALTLCSVQGRSLSGTIAVHDALSRYFTAVHLYVALSRATDGANVSVV